MHLAQYQSGAGALERHRHRVVSGQDTGCGLGGAVEITLGGQRQGTAALADSPHGRRSSVSRSTTATASASRPTPISASTGSGADGAVRGSP